MRVLVVSAMASLAAAQVTYSNGTFTCAKPNAAYCASGDSLSSDIIIRCDENGKGTPGRCEDNLAGQPPLGVNPALCWQQDKTSGIAACEKNCVVYGSSGSFTLGSDVCTPYSTAPTTTPTSTSAPIGTGSWPTTTTTPEDWEDWEDCTDEPEPTTTKTYTHKPWPTWNGTETTTYTPTSTSAPTGTGSWPTTTTTPESTTTKTYTHKPWPTWNGTETTTYTQKPTSTWTETEPCTDESETTTYTHEPTPTWTETDEPCTDETTTYTHKPTPTWTETDEPETTATTKTYTHKPWPTWNGTETTSYTTEIPLSTGTSGTGTYHHHSTGSHNTTVTTITTPYSSYIATNVPPSPTTSIGHAVTSHPVTVNGAVGKVASGMFAGLGLLVAALL